MRMWTRSPRFMRHYTGPGPESQGKSRNNSWYSGSFRITAIFSGVRRVDG